MNDPILAPAQDKAILDTRQLLAETVTTAKPRTEYLNGTRDKLPAFVRVLAKYRQLTAAQTAPVKDPVLSVPPKDPVAALPAKKAVGINVGGVDWYSSRQTFKQMLQGGYWADSKWTPLGPDKLDANGYPLDWSQSYVRLLGAPTGGWVKDTKVVVTWKGSGSLMFSGATDIVKGDHTMTMTLPSLGGKIQNRWFSLWGVDPKDPFRDFEVRDADPANATDHQYSKEIVETLSPYHTLRFMDWNATNGSPVHTLATRPNPKSLDRPTQAIENMVALCNLTNSNLWYCASWKADAAYLAMVAAYARDNLNPWLSVYFENSNEVWNYQFQQAQDSLAEGRALKIVPTNEGYSHWQNNSRRHILAVKPWEDAFKLEPKRLVRVLGTQVAYAEVTRQMLKYNGPVGNILDHIDAIAGAPYFSHDRTKPFTWALLEEDITKGAGYFTTMCDIARAAKPDILCFLYEGGQHELPTNLLPQDQFEAIQRDPRMGALYTKYLEKMTSIADLTVLFYDVGSLNKYGGWGLQEYGGQTDAPKHLAVAKFLKQ